jgi:hypothetical protein
MTRKIFTFLGVAACIFAAQNSRAQQPGVSFVLTQPPCNNNGILTANFTNLTPPLHVEWHLMNGTTIVHNGVTSASDALTGYAGGFITLTASSASPVANTDGYYQGALPFNYQVTTTSATCPANGTATATPAGGVAPYTYQWTNALTNIVASTTNPASLPNGQYHVLITDANGCTSGSYNNYGDSIFVNTVAPFDFTITGTAANCTNGTATMGPVTGSGVAPYSYLWSNGVTATSITGLVAGNYSLTVTDAQGCQRIHDKNIQQSVTIGVNPTVTPATCVQNNGSIISFGSGGVPPYSYLYSNGVTTQTASGLSAGSYSVTVTDANGCTGHSSAYVSSSTPITATYTSTPSSCTSSTGTATLNITGGATPYNVTWSTYPAQTGTTASGLAPGSYHFHITDANGCVRDGNVPVAPVNVVSANGTVSNATCTQSNGSINLMPSGGTAPYTYLWNNGATTASVTGLPAAYYSVTITDANGCHTEWGHEIEASSPINLGFSATPASCIYANDGSITSVVSGGTAPYTYLWSNGQNTPSATGLAHGLYSLHVTDANGCVRNDNAIVTYDPAGTSCYCTISGKVYNDANGNCVMDAGEAGIPNIAVHCSSWGTAYTNANGEYAFQVPSGTYTLSENVLATYPLAACQSNSVSVTTVAASGCVQTVNFANTTSTLHDMHISLWGANAAVPGNTHNQICIVSNQGTVAESAVLASYQSDGQLGATSILQQVIQSLHWLRVQVWVLICLIMFRPIFH